MSYDIYSVLQLTLNVLEMSYDISGKFKVNLNVV